MFSIDAICLNIFSPQTENLQVQDAKPTGVKDWTCASKFPFFMFFFKKQDKKYNGQKYREESWSWLQSWPKPDLK
jgi:hypothetical protein